MEKPQNPDRADPVSPPAAAEAPAPAPADEAAEPAPPQTPAPWLAQNGIYLVIIGAIVGLIAYKFGLDGLWRAFLVVIGLGFVVFIHELGHFVTAKWCDVHVQTFSIGFGPAIPGCSFKYGETLYKLALIPLGGYVNMVGEGTDADENEDYPRSFKNKTVGQRMLIISAGVIMNVLFGCLAFIAVYRLHGVERLTMDVGHTEPVGPAWTAGVRSGSKVTRIDGVENPFFDNLKMIVILSREGQGVAFQTKPRAPEGGDFDGVLTPRRDKNDLSPVIGVAPAHQLRLLHERAKSWRAMPVGYTSAAAFARAVDVSPGTEVLAATDPEKPDKITPVEGGWSEVAERLRKLRDKPLVLRVRAKETEGGASPREVTVAPAGFQWEDEIVGTTDPSQPDDYDPFVVKELLHDEWNKQKDTHDYFEFRRRMRLLMDRPVVVQVRRKGEGGEAKPTNLLVPPQHHRVSGARMRMGEVAGVRDRSPAASAGLQVGDVITRVEMTAVKPGADADGREVLGTLADFDPTRLPSELRRLARNRPTAQKFVTLTVDRPNPPGKQNGDGGTDPHEASAKVAVGPMPWDESWDFNEEIPSPSTAALSVAQLGLAYRIDSAAVSVTKGSPADKAGLKDKDELIAVALRQTTEKPATVKWQDFAKLLSTRGEQERYDRWGYIDVALQSAEFLQVQVKVRRDGKELPDPVELTLEDDATWFEEDRGLILMPDTRTQKADSMWEALKLGVSRTGEFIVSIYQSLRSLVTMRVSPDMVQGPVGIAQSAFVAAEDPWEFALLMALISVNLAVVNFLPIPILDGGHMVFLIYEKLRGKPASETVRAVATYIGLALIVALMIFVLLKEGLPLIKWWR